MVKARRKLPRWFPKSSFRLPDELSSPDRTDLRCSVLSDSSIVFCMKKTMSAATPPMKNGMRHPQAWIVASLMREDSRSRTAWAVTKPPTRVKYWNEEKKPRCPLVEASDM